MIDFIWSVYMLFAWAVVAVWMTPTIIAYRRDHRNKVVVFVASIFISVLPAFWCVIAGYLLLLAFSLYRSPEVMVVQGPQGPPGPRGLDADEIPLSSAGVAKPPKRP